MSQAFHVDSPQVIFFPTWGVATKSLLKLASIIALDRPKGWESNQEYQQELEDKD
jgi:hypothetical protein